MAIEGEGGAGSEAGTADALFGGAAGGSSGGGGGSDAAAGAGGEGGGSGDGGGEGGAFEAPDWVEKLSAEAEGETASNRDYVQSKGFKDLDSMVKSLRHAEKAIHDKGMITVPKEGAKPEEVAAFNKAIGVPDKVDGYEVKGPDGVALNQPLIDAMRESALKHGAPKGAFEGLIGDFIQAQMDEAAAETQRQDELAAAKLKEWGGKKEEQVTHVNSAMRALGLSAKDGMQLRNALGADRALDLLAKLGAGMAEDTMLTGGKGRFGISGAEAKSELDRLKTDPEWAKKAMIAGTPERARYDRLNAAAAEYEVSQQAA